VSDIDRMREALEKVGIPTKQLDDEKVIAASSALFNACADFGAALGHVFTDRLTDIGERFRRLADFAETIEKLAAQERRPRS
jgi:hypothetical protein